MFVKIDGVTNLDDALMAAAHGADAIGFVFAHSPRQVDVATVREIVPRLPEHVMGLGVFVDAPPAEVLETMRLAGLRAAQLHGTETPRDARLIRDQVEVVFKAFRAGDPRLKDAVEFGADAVIVDSPHGGGSGASYDWTLARQAPSDIKVILAGGLTPSTVRAAIRSVRPWGVDVSSGVEISPGRKDPDRLRAFITAAKSALDEPSGDPDAA